MHQRRNSPRGFAALKPPPVAPVPMPSGNLASNATPFAQRDLHFLRRAKAGARRQGSAICLPFAARHRQLSPTLARARQGKRTRPQPPVARRAFDAATVRADWSAPSVPLKPAEGYRRQQREHRAAPPPRPGLLPEWPPPDPQTIPPPSCRSHSHPDTAHCRTRCPRYMFTARFLSATTAAEIAAALRHHPAPLLCRLQRRHDIAVR